MKESKFVLIFGLVILIGMGLTLFYHESAHQAVFSMNGVPSHLNFDLMGGHTVPDVNSFSSVELQQSSNIGNGVIEAVGYQVMPMVLMICAIIGLCTLYLGSKIGEKK